MEKFSKDLLSSHGGLDDWFGKGSKGNWKNLRKPKENGGYEDCGRSDTSKGSKPVCVPADKIKNLDKNEIENRKKQKAKEEKKPNPDKQPNKTNYTDQAGGKSTKSSNNNNISFMGSTIPLSDLRSKQPKFIKKSGIEDEGGFTGHEKPPFEIPNPGDEKKQQILDEMHEITNSHPAVLYVADLYENMMNIIQDVYPPNFVEVIETSFTNAGDENFDEFYPKLVDSMIASASDPYDPLLKTALDYMKEVSEMFNIFHKDAFHFFMMAMMRRIVEFEVSLKDKRNENTE
jgi:hypothetical protein